MIDEEMIDCNHCGYTHREGYDCTKASAIASNDGVKLPGILRQYNLQVIGLKLKEEYGGGDMQWGILIYDEVLGTELYESEIEAQRAAVSLINRKIEHLKSIRKELTDKILKAT